MSFAIMSTSVWLRGDNIVAGSPLMSSLPLWMAVVVVMLWLGLMSSPRGMNLSKAPGEGWDHERHVGGLAMWEGSHGATERKGRQSKFGSPKGMAVVLKAMLIKNNRGDNWRVTKNSPPYWVIIDWHMAVSTQINGNRKFPNNPLKTLSLLSNRRQLISLNNCEKEDENQVKIREGLIGHNIQTKPIGWKVESTKAT